MMLEAVNLNKFFGARQALDGVSFAIDKGETVGFLGVNGAGKSTTMRILTGFISPNLGYARVAGLDPRLPMARRKIGYLPESNPLPPHMRAGEYLAFRARLKGLPRSETRPAVERTAERCGVGDALDRLIGHLSKGMRQRVGLADSLIADPEVLILDEPTAGLDPAQAEETRGLIASLRDSSTILFSSHILHDVERLCRRVVILDKGKVAADDALDDICEKNIEERTVVMEMLAAEPVRETLRSLPGVRAVQINADPAGKDTLTVRVTTPAGIDLRREMSLLSAKRGWLITEMRMEPVRLEDIFRRLTRGG